MSTAEDPWVAAGLREARRPGHIVWTIDDPARKNPITPDALRHITQTCARLAGEVVVLRGAGDHAFCAGYDLRALAEAEPAATDSREALPDAPLVAATRAMVAADATFIAAIGGPAIGAGVGLACACDLRIATPDAWFQVPAARLGVVYPGEGLARMRGVFGAAGVAGMLLLGRRLTASEALAAGALLEIVEPADVDNALAEIAARLTAGAPLSIAGNRTLLRALSHAAAEPAVRAAHDAARRRAYASEDHREARAAVAERRRPRFKGR